jgi:glycosyltransferase involved in cell wall biosynthesis
VSAGLSLTVILPCFEEAGALPDVVDRLRQALADLAPDPEVLLVCAEAARDGTPALAEALARGWPALRVVHQDAGDPGYGRAVSLGLAAATRPLWALLDADGQLDPADLPRLAARLPEADLVLGVRAPRRDAWPRRASAALYGATARALLGLPRLADLDAALKLGRRDLLGDAPLTARTGAVNAELIRRAVARGARIVEVPVAHHPRAAGRSRFESILPGLGAIPRPEAAVALALDVLRLWRRGSRP